MPQCHYLNVCCTHESNFDKSLKSSRELEHMLMCKHLMQLPYVMASHEFIYSVTDKNRLKIAAAIQVLKECYRAQHNVLKKT